MTLDEFFAGYEDARPLFDAVAALVASAGPAEIRVSKSQIAFSRRRGFAWAWIPERYLKRPAAPLVLSLALDRRDDSPRFKQVVEPQPGRFMHHVELHAASDLDAEIAGWLREAWGSAG